MAKPESPTQALIKRLLPKKLGKRVDRRYKLRNADFVVVSFPKCGRTWLRVMLSTFYQRKYGYPDYETLGFENLHRKDACIPRVYFSHDDCYKARPGELKRDKSEYTAKKVIFLMRDPRDVVVSLYFHRARRDHELDIPLMDFVTGEAGGLRTIIEFYNIWFAALDRIPSSTVLRYEDLRDDPVAGLQGLFDFMGEQADREILEVVAEETSFSRMKEKEEKGLYDRRLLRAENTSDAESFKVRRGKVGGYRDYLADHEIETVDAMLKQYLRRADIYE